ncbi:MAG: CDP-diacylglycerol--serine O-phosphatidyltransferase [Parvibaculaceae bacterium]
MRALPRKLGKAEHDLRFVLPNLFTAASLCAGMTAMLLASQERIALAVLSIFVAAILDACDGRIARLTGTTSRFGGELDSLADVVSFGAAPAFVVYCWGLETFGMAGWLPCLALATCCALRLARFNVAQMDLAAPAWTANYFTGVPAPAGAFLALAPILAELSEALSHDAASWLALFVLTAVAGLMISTWPTFSGKAIGRKASRLMLLPPVALAGLLTLGLLEWPWATLLVMAILYVATLPISKWRHGVLLARGRA